MPGIMRLFVRVEGHSPFSLILADNLLPEHYEEIAVKYFRENWHSRQAPDLILIRRMVFKNNDQLFDFKKKKRSVKPPVLHDRDGMSRSNIYAHAKNPDMLKQELLTTNPQLALGAYCETELIIKAATLGRLVMKMTDPVSSRFIEHVFLDTYRSVATPHEFLDALIDRYDVPQIASVGAPQRSPLDKEYYDDVVLGVRQRVFQVLEAWVDKYYFDFAEDAVYHRLHKFVRDKVDTDGAPSVVLAKMKVNDRTALAQRKPKLLPGVLNKSLTPSTVIASFPPKDIANQLTLLTLHVHNQVRPPELLGRQWEGAAAANVPNFIAYRDFINKVSNWVSYAILSEQSESARVNNMAQLLLLCDELLRMNNWDMLVAVYGGITDPSVARLTLTANNLPREAQQLLPKFEELLSLKGTTKMIKHAMASSPRPRFPSIVIHLRDLIHLDQVPKEADGMVNFVRCIQQYNLVNFLLDGRFQRLEYVPNLELMGVFSFWPVVDDKVLEALSRERQAR